MESQQPKAGKKKKLKEKETERKRKTERKRSHGKSAAKGKKEKETATSTKKDSGSRVCAGRLYIQRLLMHSLGGRAAEQTRVLA